VYDRALAEQYRQLLRRGRGRISSPVSAASRWNGAAFTKSTPSPAAGPWLTKALALRYYATVRASVPTAGRIKTKRVRSSLYTINESTLSFGKSRGFSVKALSWKLTPLSPCGRDGSRHTRRPVRDEPRQQHFKEQFDSTDGKSLSVLIRVYPW
jgi:hypothetical protein